MVWPTMCNTCYGGRVGKSMKGVELEGSQENFSWPAVFPKCFRPKTKRPRPGLSHGTNRSNRFLPRETVQQEHSLPPEGWEGHECAIWGKSGFPRSRPESAMGESQGEAGEEIGYWVASRLPKKVVWRGIKPQRLKAGLIFSTYGMPGGIR